MSIKKEIWIVGFSIFGFLFGAGNLLFPQQLGLQSGPFWFVSFLGFSITDVVLSIIAIIAFIKYKSFKAFMQPMGSLFTSIYTIISVILVMFLLIIPRTAVTIYESAIFPLFPNFPSLFFYTIYFGLALILALKPYRVLDIIGKYIAPIFFFILFSSLVYTLFNSTAMKTVESVSVASLFPNSFVKGYETIDALATILLGGLLSNILNRKGYDINSRAQILIKGAGITMLLMIVLYAILMYLGSIAGDSVASYNPIQLLVHIFEPLGDFKFLIIGTMLTLAGFSIVLGDMALGSFLLANMVHNGDSKKVDESPFYRFFLVISFVFGLTMTFIGFAGISNITAPLLDIIYPTLLIILFFNMIEVRSPMIVRPSVYVTLLSSILYVCAETFNLNWAYSITEYFPLNTSSFIWLIPATTVAIICAVINKSRLSR